MTKGKIRQFFVKNLPSYTTGRKVKVPMWKIVRAILYKLKTGIQWKHLPMKELFGNCKYSWESVYYHFNKWSKQGAWEKCYLKLLSENRRKLDMSIVNLDGTHTPAKRGGEAVGYQGMKKLKTTNLLILCDKQGVPLSWSQPISAEHNDAFELTEKVEKMFNKMEANNLPIEGIVLNADAGFDIKTFRDLCIEKDILHNIDFNKRNRKQEDKKDDYVFDNELYKNRFCVEQLNAWVDGFKSLIIRYETSTTNWLSLHALAFCVIFLRKLTYFNL